MRLLIHILSIILLCLLLHGCAQLTQMEIESTCSTSQAYSAGINNGRTNSPMQSNYAGICPTDQSIYNESYRKGYKFGLEQYAKKVDINIDNSNSHNPDRKNEKWGCIDSPFATNGQICGYDCIKSNFGNIYCGKTKHDNCIKGTMGDVKCGLHCRKLPYGKGITCEKESYSKDSHKD